MNVARSLETISVLDPDGRDVRLGERSFASTRDIRQLLRHDF
jgi:hypothetical protein